MAIPLDGIDRLFSRDTTIDRRRHLVPDRAGSALLVAIVVERLHEGLVELGLLLWRVEVVTYVFEIVVDAIAPADEVDSQHVVVAARRQHGADRPAGDRDGPRLRFGEIGIEPG